MVRVELRTGHYKTSPFLALSRAETVSMPELVAAPMFFSWANSRSSTALDITDKEMFALGGYYGNKRLVANEMPAITTILLLFRISIVPL